MLLAADGINPWAPHAHPEVWAVMAVSLALYFLALSVIGPAKVAPGEPVATSRQVAAFVAGVAILWLASDFPVHDLAEQYLYSVHMTQHELLTLPAPPLLLLGLPDWLVRWIVSWRPAGALARVASHPVAAGAIFSVSVVVFHVPAVVNATLYHHTLHFIAHLAMFSGALVMWFPVTNRLPEYRRMSYPAKILYLFLMTVVPELPIFFLALSTGVIYHYYAHVPRPFSLSALGDQQLAGGIMNAMNVAFFLPIGAVLFFKWAEQEDTIDRRPAGDRRLEWEEVLAHVEHAGRPGFATRRST